MKDEAMAAAVLSQSTAFLLETGYFSVILADEDLRVLSAAGQLAQDAPAGSAVCDVVPALTGMEPALIELKYNGEEPLKIPNVRTFKADGTNERIDYVISWHAEWRQYLVYLSRTIAIDETAVELQREARRRRLAEEQLLLQAEAIREANANLMDANEDLQAFTRIISHDLKAPLRAMRYFTEDLEASLGEEGGSDSKIHLDRLKTQSRRMSAMISGLLSYTRLERDAAGEREHTGTPTQELVDEIIASLPLPAGFVVKAAQALDNLPAPRPIADVIIRNVIENAQKHHDLAKGHVTISTSSTENTVTLTIEDDGPGIAKDLQEAAFNPFTQLEPETAGGGVGMGLTLVKRATDVSGGSLRLTSDPGARRGTRFDITWPTMNKSE